MKNIVFAIMFFTIIACSGKTEDNKTDKPIEQVKQIKAELKQYQTILEYASVPENIFLKSYKSLKPEESDIETAEKLLQYAFDDQKRPTVNRVAGKTLDEYYEQYIFAVNDKGEKVAWINCFCKSQESDFKNWKTNIVIVKDGGNCFFNAKVNLTKKIYEEFNVNGNG